jgi:hypothetical protein
MPGPNPGSHRENMADWRPFNGRSPANAAISTASTFLDVIFYLKSDLKLRKPGSHGQLILL